MKGHYGYDTDMPKLRKAARAQRAERIVPGVFIEGGFSYRNSNRPRQRFGTKGAGVRPAHTRGTRREVSATRNS